MKIPFHSNLYAPAKTGFPGAFFMRILIESLRNFYEGFISFYATIYDACRKL